MCLFWENIDELNQAFIKLEALEELSEEEREEYQELAMDIFVKYSPKVSR